MEGITDVDYEEYSNPLFSVIVPVYNIEEYLKKCITSIIEQTYKNIEIILIDDGSTDKSALICDEFAEKDKRIKVVHKENGGVVSARKVGISIASGEYVISVDGDDWIEKERLEHLADQISLVAADMIYMAGYKKDTDKQCIVFENSIECKTYYGEEIIKDLFPLVQNTHKCFEPNIKGLLWMWGINRELLKEKQMLIDDRISIGDDYICVWFCLLAAKSVTLMNEGGYHYIQRNTSLSYSKSNEERMRMGVWHNQLKEYIESCNYTAEVMKSFVFLNVMVLMFADYEMLLLKDVNYLFPYSKVVKKSRIVIYGAGKLGCHIIWALDRNKDYQIVLWVDQNEKRPSILNYKINPIDNILQVDYDFVVIAIMHESIALEIKELLLNMGIQEKKIAMMDPNVISEAYLDKVFGDK